MRIPLFPRSLIAFSILAAFGCGSHEADTAVAAPPKPVDPAVAAQKRAALIQTLSTMTPDQRAAYLQAHPDDVQALQVNQAP